MVRLILTEEKPKERKFTMKSDKIGKYFSDNYSNEEIENIIISLLDKWKKEAQDKIKLFKQGKLEEDKLYNWMIENK